jgi:uncharacterized membrane protein
MISNAAGMATIMNASLSSYALGYVAAAVAMLALDAVWLTLTANALYRPMIGELMVDGFRLAPAAVFYVLYLCGVVFFAIHPALATGRWTTALLSGALLGLLAFGTYDLTNQATLKVWPTALTLADMGWGCFLTAVSATAGYFAASALAK